MHQANHSQFRHSHDFTRDFSRGERRTRIVIAITGVMMVVEITAGLLSHSMALLADGWHMSTHVTAFLITAIAYYFTRQHASDERFSFGTGKIGVLGGFASAVVLSVVALLMAGESVHRIFVPMVIHFNEAIGIACVALTVVGTGKFAAIVSIVAHAPKTCEAYRERLREHAELVHVTIETQHCREDHESLATP
jgi:cation diffusion facilitator family transporter